MSLISSLSILIPLLVGLIYFNKSNHLQKWFLGFIIISALFDVVVSYMARHGMNNLWVFKIFLVFDFVFFTWFFSRITAFPRWKWILTIFVSILILFSQLYPGNIGPYNLKNGLFFISAFLYFIIQSGYMIIITFDDFSKEDIKKNYVFWIAFARLFYFLIIVFIYIYPNFIPNGYTSKFLDSANTTINMLANVLLNLIYAISFLCHSRKI